MKPKKVNAKHNRSIRITAADACKAKRRDHQNCVIAKAIKREMNAHWVDVGASTVLVQRKHNSKVERFLLDATACEQIRYFDGSGAFAPCRVQLRKPGVAGAYKGMTAKRKTLDPNRRNSRRTLATR